MASAGTFFSNYEPFTIEQARALVDHVAEFDKYTEPMKHLLKTFVADRPTDYVVSSAHPRMVDGKPSKNPRYLAEAARPGESARQLSRGNRRATGARNSGGPCRCIFR